MSRQVQQTAEAVVWRERDRSGRPAHEKLEMIDPKFEVRVFVLEIRACEHFRLVPTYLSTSR